MSISMPPETGNLKRLLLVRSLIGFKIQGWFRTPWRLLADVLRLTTHVLTQPEVLSGIQNLKKMGRVSDLKV